MYQFMAEKTIQRFASAPFYFSNLLFYRTHFAFLVAVTQADPKLAHLCTVLLRP